MAKRPAILLAVMAALAVSGAAHAQGRYCLRVETPAAVVLPDGSVQAAGTLRVCRERAYSPSFSLHEIYVDGAPLGLFRARNLAAERESGAPPYVVFRRTDEESLVLVGHGWPGRQGAAAYRLEPVPVVRVRTAGVARDATESRLVLIASAD